MAEEHEARQPYKCAVCGAKFDSQEKLQAPLQTAEGLAYPPSVKNRSWEKRLHVRPMENVFGRW